MILTHWTTTPTDCPKTPGNSNIALLLCLLMIYADQKAVQAWANVLHGTSKALVSSPGGIHLVLWLWIFLRGRALYDCVRGKICKSLTSSCSPSPGHQL